MRERRDKRKNLWKESTPQVGALIPSIAGEKRFKIGRDEIVNYGDIALEEVKGFLSLLAAFSMGRVELNTEIWQEDDLDFNEVRIKVQWGPYPTLARKKRNGSIKWNEARRYSRMRPFNQMMRQIDRQVRSEVISADEAWKGMAL